MDKLAPSVLASWAISAVYEAGDAFGRRRGRPFAYHFRYDDDDVF